MDMQALQTAIEQSPEGGVLSIPPGKYRITEMINITSSIILRGAGPDKTALYFPFSLAHVYGNVPDATSGYSQWAFRPGFINILGSDPIGPDTILAHVTKAASKGQHVLTIGGVTNSSALDPGAWVRLVQSDPGSVNTEPSDGDAGNGSHSGSLIQHLYGGWDVISHDAPPHVHAGELQGTQYAAQLIAKVVRVKGNNVTLDRPLPFDVHTHWKPELHTVKATLRDAGVESLSIEFAQETYAGHFKEAGYNALYISAVHDCWVRGVHIINADYGIGLNGTHFCTLEGINMYDGAPREGGHHGIDISYGADNLVANFSIGKEFLHDLSVEWYTHGNVFSDGSGVDLNLDHHRGVPFGNLFTNLHLGKGTRPFASSGAHGRGAHAGAHNTYWNFLSDKCLQLPDSDFGRSLNFLGMQSPVPCSIQQFWGKKMFPPNLYNAFTLWGKSQPEVSSN